MTTTVGTTAQEIRLDAWRSVLQKADRIMSGEPVTVTLLAPEAVPYEMESMPAWSDGAAILLNGKRVSEMLATNDAVAAVLRLKGLNYHELCHVLYTPRRNDDIVRQIHKLIEDNNGDTKFWYSFNALEDQRIETTFTANYSATRRYFEAIVLEWIIREGNAEAFILLYGRKYLSPKIRVQAGRVFKKKYGEDLHYLFTKVIDEYVTLSLPTDAFKARELIIEYRELLRQMQDKVQGTGLPVLVMEDNGGDGNPNRGDVVRAGRVLVKQAKRDRDVARDMVEDAIDADADVEAELEASPKGDDEGEPGDAGADGQGDGQEGQEGSSEPQDSKAATSGKGAQQSNAEGSSGDGSSATGSADHDGDEDLADMFRDLMDEAYDQMDDVVSDPTVQKDVDNALDAVRAAEANGKIDAAGSRSSTHYDTPTDAESLAVRRVHNILTRIRQEAEPETLYRQVHGRIDPQRAMTSQPHEVDVFRSWDSGSEDETGVEAVLLVDMSGSMRSIVRSASAAMWVLKRAFDKLDIRTTVLLFDTHHAVLFQPSDRARPNGLPVFRDGGGTDPTSALQEALLVLTKSQAPNKVLITVTDGGWQCDEKVVAGILKALHKQGVTSLMLGLSNAVQYHGKHSHQHGHDIRTISEMPKVATKLVAGIMRSKVV